MTPGTLLLYAAVVTAFATPLAFLAATRDDRFDRYGRLLSGATAGLFLTALGYLAYQFVVTDYTNAYVTGHTADYLSVWYRLTGIYAGVEGSLLLWTTAVAVSVFWLAARRADRRDARLVSTVATGLLAYFAVVVVMRSPFQPPSFGGGSILYLPRGLNPLLINPYMGIHPVVTFAGYATTTVPFAVGIAHFYRRLQGDDGLFRAWLPTVIQWMRATWVFLTVAVALGAFWSYNTLGWGGLWAWDPVETGILVSWLFITAAVHALANLRRRGSNPILTGALATLSLPSVVFARYVTIGGFSQLHSFGLGSTTPTLFLLSATAALGVGLPLLTWLWRADPPDDDSALLSVDVGLYLSVLLILTVAFVYAWGILFPEFARPLFGIDVSITTDFYNMWSFPFAALILLLIGAVNDLELQGNRFLWTAGLVVVATVVVALVPMPEWTFAASGTSPFATYLNGINTLALVPPSLYAIGTVLVRLWRWIQLSESRADRLDALGRATVHIGLAVLVLATPYTYLLATSGTYVVPTETDEGLSISGGNETIAVDAVHRKEVKSAVSFTDEERSLVESAIETRGYPSGELPTDASGNVIVWGQPTAVESNETRRLVRLDETNVWVELPADRPADLALDTLVGDSAATLYVQGTVTDSSSERRIVQTNGQFAGTDPVDAVVPERRVNSVGVDVRVSKGETQIAKGRATLNSHYPSGHVVDVLIEKGLLRDIYVVPLQVDTIQGYEVAAVEVKKVPMMTPVRFAVFLLVFGGILRFISGKTDTDWQADDEQ